MSVITLSNFQSHFTVNYSHSPSDIQKTNAEWMALFCQIVSSRGCRLILHYGTCLGIIRDQAIIPDDTDADFGLFVPDLPLLLDCIDELEKAHIFLEETCPFNLRFNLPNTSFTMDIWPIKKQPFWINP